MKLDPVLGRIAITTLMELQVGFIIISWFITHLLYHQVKVKPATYEQDAIWDELEHRKRDELGTGPDPGIPQSKDIGPSCSGTLNHQANIGSTVITSVQDDQQFDQASFGVDYQQNLYNEETGPRSWINHQAKTESSILSADHEQLSDSHFGDNHEELDSKIQYADFLSSLLGDTGADPLSSLLGDIFTVSAEKLTGVRTPSDLSVVPPLLLGDTGADPLRSLLGDTGADSLSSLLGDTGADSLSTLLGDTGADPLSSLLGDIFTVSAEKLTGVRTPSDLSVVPPLLLGDTGADPLRSLLGDTGADSLRSLLGDTGADSLSSLLGDTGADPLSSLLGDSGAPIDAPTEIISPVICSIEDFAPDWGYAYTSTKVLITGSFINSDQQHGESCQWYCVFGEDEVRAEHLSMSNILRCYTPLKKAGRVEFYVKSSHGSVRSEVMLFEFRNHQNKEIDNSGSYGNIEVSQTGFSQPLPTSIAPLTIGTSHEQRMFEVDQVPDQALQAPPTKYGAKNKSRRWYKGVSDFLLKLGTSILKVGCGGLP